MTQNRTQRFNTNSPAQEQQLQNAQVLPARSANLSARDMVMLEFQRSSIEITRTFIESQQRVMLAYLSRGEQAGAVTYAQLVPQQVQSNGLPIEQSVIQNNAYQTMLPAAQVIHQRHEPASPVLIEATATDIDHTAPVMTFIPNGNGSKFAEQGVQQVNGAAAAQGDAGAVNAPLQSSARFEAGRSTVASPSSPLGTWQP